MVGQAARKSAWLLAAGGIIATILAGCATQPAPVPEPLPDNVAEPVPEQAPAAEKSGLGTSLKHLVGRNLKPIPTRPLNARSSCSFKDPTGYKGKILLLVKEARVQQFSAQVDVPRKGSCQFNLKHFEQVETLPQVKLAAADGCSVRMWEQGKKVTVAFSGCQAQCSGDAVDYLWPIQLENRRCF